MAPYVEWFAPRTVVLPPRSKVHVSKPEKPESEIQKEKETMEMLKEGNKCRECDYYRKLIEFYHNIFIVLVGGFVVKLLLDSILQKK